MALTRQYAESVIVNRCGGYLRAAEVDTSQSGPIVFLEDSFSWAFSQIGVIPLSSPVADDDFTRVTVDDTNKFLDLAELRTMENIIGNLALVDISVGPRREALSQLSTRAEAVVSRLEQKIAKLYGVGYGSLSSGVIEMDFQEKWTGA